MKKKIALALFLFAVIPAALVSADQIELTNRQSGNAVERIVFDDVTNQVTVYRNGAVTATRAATEREIAAGEQAKLASDRQSAVADLKAIIADMQANPSRTPEVQRVEAAVIALAKVVGAE